MLLQTFSGEGVLLLVNTSIVCHWLWAVTLALLGKIPILWCSDSSANFILFNIIFNQVFLLTCNVTSPQMCYYPPKRVSWQDFQTKTKQKNLYPAKILFNGWSNNYLWLCENILYSVHIVEQETTMCIVMSWGIRKLSDPSVLILGAKYLVQCSNLLCNWKWEQAFQEGGSSG